MFDAYTGSMGNSTHQSVDDVDRVPPGNESVGLAGRVLAFLAQPLVRNVLVVELLLIVSAYAVIGRWESRFANLYFGMAISLAGLVVLVAVVVAFFYVIDGVRSD